MTTTLSEGVKVPDVGSVNWAGDLEVNWNLLNGALANLSGNVKTDRDNTWTGEQTFSLPIVGSITGTASKAIADEDGTSIKTGYVNVAGNQTVSGDKSFTGSNTFNSILPNTTNTYSLGSSSYQWSSVYAQTYYYNGTAWGLDKANVWTGTQTIEQSTFAQLRLKNSTIKLGDAIPSSNKTVGTVTFSGSDNSNMGFIDYRDSVLGNTFIRILARQKYDANGNRSTSGTIYESGIDIGVLNDKTPYVAPVYNSTTNLGTSTNKWKTLNGINPGALGIPDKGNMVNIASEFTDLTGGFNYYIPPADGFVSINADTDVYCAVVSSTHNTAFWRQSAVATSTGYASVTIPVRAGLHLQAKINSTVAIYAAFYPCLGNV